MCEMSEMKTRQYVRSHGSGAGQLESKWTKLLPTVPAGRAESKMSSTERR